MTRRDPKLSLTLRIVAGACAVLWLAGVTVCNLEAFFGCDSHGHAVIAHNHGEHSHETAVADTVAHHAHDAGVHHSDNAEPHHASDADGHSHDSHKHDGKESSCCSTLKAVVQTAKSIDVPNQILQPIALLFVLFDGCIFALDTPGTASARPLPSREWIVTPEVCTGPANRSHAPPCFI